METWAHHIISIRNRIMAGCKYGPDDLSEAEWRGLVVLEAEISRMPVKGQGSG